MVDDNIERSWADALWNGELLYISTFSGRRRTARDPKGKEFFLQPDADDQTIGEAVLHALESSRVLTMEEANAFFDFENSKRLYEDWVVRMIDRYGYKSRRGLFKDMKDCWIEHQGDKIIFKPTHHDKLEGWSGEGIHESDYVVLPASSTSMEIGAALRLALSRCS